MPTDNIEEAQIIAETTPAAESIHQRLSQQTETKPPTTTPANEAWFMDDNTPTGTPPPANTGKTPPAQPVAGQELDEAPTSKSIDVGAETLTAMWEQILEGVFTWRVNRKYRKKFSDQEIEDVNAKNLEDTPEEQLVNEQEKILAKKWRRLMAKRDKEIKNIQMTPEEYEQTKKSFLLICKARNIALPPEWALAFNMTFQVIDRITETADF